jgi:biotin synthase
MTREEILCWLKETDEKKLEGLWSRADAVRKERVGDEVHLRGLVELSNHCVRGCAYCGIRSENRGLKRYRMTEAEVVVCAKKAVRFGYGTVVLQAGEDPGLTQAFVSKLIRRIKGETPLAVTLGLGERSVRDLEAWRKAGADRYFLRFETSDPGLYERVHPSLPRRRSDRIGLLPKLREIGFEIGSGVMLGLPGQAFASLVDDLELFRALDLDMVGAGPYLPHPATPLARQDNIQPSIAGRSQVPNTELMTYKFLALTRLTCSDVNIPTTTALASLNRRTGYELGLSRGANVIMPNLTPRKYRVLYEIYPAKAHAPDSPEEFQATLEKRLAAIGRRLGKGPGARRKR